ncbi:hypothetical protein B566_EDAN007546 [Ephemera danica]|nr:hypothetical protein B566_EDAN007546 [Ephemera danica]
MEAALAHRVRVRQSRLKNLVSLETLCVRAVAENLDFFKKKEHLFATLPWSVLDSLLQNCPELRSPDWIEFVAQEQAQNLSVQLGPQQRVAASLRGLSLSWCVRDEVEATVSGALCRLLCSLPHLRVLKLHRLPVTDKVLEVIACTCTQLRSLELLGASRVSPEQMCELINSCPEIEELSFAGIRDCSSVLKQALLSLEKLRILNCTGIESILGELANEKPKLKLQEIHLSAYNFDSVFPTSNLTEMLPCLHELSLEGFTDVGPFLKFEHVSKLLLKGSENFSKLKVVFLQPYVESASRLIPIASSVMYRMLSAPKLNHFSSYFILLSHTLLCNLIAEAEEGGVVFSELEYLDADVIELPADLAIQLVCAAPKLRELSLQRMLEEDLDQLLAFLRTNLPRLSCSMV